MLSKSAVRRRAAAMLWVFVALAGEVSAQVPAPLPPSRLNLTVAGVVSSIAVHPDGGQIIVGAFSSINGVPRDGLARIRADGTLDPLWYPRVRWSGDASGPVRRRVYALPDGSVLVFGDFQNINGQALLGCAAKLSSDPSPLVIESWRLNANCLPIESVLDDEGWLYFSAVGSIRRARADTGEWDSNWFSYVDSGNPMYDGRGGLILPRQGVLSRVSTSTGATMWTVPLAGWSGALVGAGTGSEPDALFLGWSSGQVDKRSLATGENVDGWPKQVSPNQFTFAVGADDVLYAGGNQSVTALSAATGAYLRNWLVEGINQMTRDLRPRAGGGVYVGGSFARFGEVPALGLIELASPGTTPAVLANAENRGYAEFLARQPDGHVVVSGTFDRAEGAERLRLLRLMPDGTLDPDWRPRVDGWISLLAADSGGDIYIGGAFSRVDEHDPDNNLAKIDGTTAAVVADWNPWFGGRHPTGIAIDDSDRVYVSTDDASPQVAYRLRPDGSIDPDWTPPGASGRMIGLQRVGNDLYFSFMDNASAVSTRRLSITTAAVDPQWQLDLSLYALSIVRADDGDLLLGGSFTQVNGEPRGNLARVSSTAPVQVRAWNPSPNGPIGGLGRSDSGRIFVSGSFTTIGGKPRNGLAELAPSDGAVLDGWIPPYGGGRQVVVGDRIYLNSAQRGIVAFPLDIGDTIFATHFD